MKPIVKDVQISIDHVEQALMAYLRPFFPEAIEIEGVDITFPLSAPLHLEARVHLRARNTAVISEPANDNVVSLKAKKERKRVEKGTADAIISAP